MQNLAKNTISLALLVLVLALASGCSVTRRYVTHTVSGTGGPNAMATLPADVRVGGPEDEVSEPTDDAKAPGDAMEAVPTEATVETGPPTAAVDPVEATRWMYIAYAEVKETNLIFMKQFQTDSKVLRCLIKDDNSVVCAEQEDANRLFNPQNQ